MVKNPPSNAGDPGLIPVSGRAHGEGNSSPLQCSCLGDPMNSGAWRVAAHGFAKESDIIEQLNNSNMSSVGHSHPAEKVILSCIIILF